MMQSLRLLAYEIPLTRPIDLNQSGQRFTMHKRNGLVLHWQFSDAELYTEIAPLTGFSQETLVQARDQLLALPAECLQPEADLSAFYPSVRFALQAGWYQRKYPLRKKAVNCCAFSTGNRSTNCIKIKAGHTPLEEELPALRERLDQLQPEQKYRIDANRSWSLEELTFLQQNLDLTNLEYIEEPLTDLADYQGIELPIAFDESLREQVELEKLPQMFFRSKAWVVKPMLTGLSETLKLADLARRNNIQLVLSSSFESHITLEFYHSLAQDLGLEIAQGLDTLAWMENDLIPPTISLREQPVPRAELQDLGRIC